MRYLCLVAALFCVCLLVGCFDAPQHRVYTGADGSLDGMVITPDPQSVPITTGADFELYWPSGYQPPSTFTFKLESVANDGSTQAQLTREDDVSSRDYVFHPAGLPTHTFLLLTITGAGQTVRAMYLTNGDPTIFAPVVKGMQAEHQIHAQPAQ